MTTPMANITSMRLKPRRRQRRRTGRTLLIKRKSSDMVTRLPCFARNREPAAVVQGIGGRVVEILGRRHAGVHRPDRNPQVALILQIQIRSPRVDRRIGDPGGERLNRLGTRDQEVRSARRRMKATIAGIDSFDLPARRKEHHDRATCREKADPAPVHASQSVPDAAHARPGQIDGDADGQVERLRLRAFRTQIDLERQPNGEIRSVQGGVLLDVRHGHSLFVRVVNVPCTPSSSTFVTPQPGGVPKS